MKLLVNGLTALGMMVLALLAGFGVVHLDPDLVAFLACWAIAGVCIEKALRS